MSDFTPWSALLGGALIGLAAVSLLATLGRIAGISGIVATAALGEGRERHWRLAFVAGLLTAWPLWLLVVGEAPAFRSTASWPLAVVAGLLVGFGTRFGSGCTSGHGVCGLARLSPRSLLATGVFMGTGIATVALMRWSGGGLS